MTTANDDADSGGCTDANPAAADTIRLDAGDYNLRRAGVEDINASGDLDVRETLRIVGAGADLTGIDGNGATTGDRVLFALTGTLTITGVTVHDGSAPASSINVSGGGILSDGPAVLKLIDSTVSGNESGNGHGGGIWAVNATLIDSTVSHNTADGSGGGFGGFDATLINSTVRDNQASDGGGGVSASTATLTNSAVRNNNAGLSGGGIQSYTVTLTNSRVSDNDASFDGGGIHQAQGGVAVGKLTNSVVSRNGAGEEGGGIYAESGPLAVTGSTIADNESTNNGGAIFFTSPQTLNVVNSTLSGNESEAWGGALSTDEGTINLRSATITRNMADADAAGVAGDGGGLDRFGTAIVNLRNTILAGNLDQSLPEHPDWNCRGDVISQGYNLLSNTAGCPVAPATGDQTAPDPGLASLANNGGNTPTHALLSSSPARNTGHPAAPGSGAGACPATEQRGIPRSLGGRCDKGAYERVSCEGKLVNLVGTGGPDLLVGTSAADGILALGGDDTLRGGSAADGLCGQDGDDQLFGEAGPDSLDGGIGTDICDGGTESDQAVACETIASVP